MQTMWTAELWAGLKGLTASGQIISSAAYIITTTTTTTNANYNCFNVHKEGGHWADCTCCSKNRKD